MRKRLKEIISGKIRNAEVFFRSNPQTGKSIYFISFILILVFLLNISVILAPAFQQGIIHLLPCKKINKPASTKDPDRYMTELVKENLFLKRKLLLKIPPGPYLVINHTDNHFQLYYNRKLRREGFCSTGS